LQEKKEEKKEGCGIRELNPQPARKEKEWGMQSASDKLLNKTILEKGWKN